MSIELLILFGILLAKAQKAFSPASAVQTAQDSQAKANQAQADAAAAAAKGDQATAAQKAAEAQQHAATAATAARAAKTPPPWPQVVPSGLPPYPGPGWRAASPVTGAMSARAWQLLPDLWGHGEGTWKLEKTGDKWVVYTAAFTSPGKKGVTAKTPIALAPAGTSAADNVPQAMTPALPPQPRPATPTAPGTQTAVVPASTAAPVATGFPTLRLTSPRTSGPSVVWLQQHLGIGADGVFGTGTDAAVKHFQATHGLTADGIVGPKTWAALGASNQRAA